MALIIAAPGVAQAIPQEALPPLQERPAALTDVAAEQIIVTGTRIARPNLEQSSPVSVVDSVELRFRQPISAEQVLRDIPGIVPGINENVNNGTNGTATINLRGLGTNRNLVLLNSRRVVPSTLGGVPDTNVIPVALIERAEVLTGGATTVYGADAIAGVVNFITRRDFAGVDLSATYGLTERGDGANYRLDATIGANFDDGRGNAVFSIGYTRSDPVTHGSREVGLVSRASTCNPAQTNPAAANSCARPFGADQGSGAATPATIFAPFTAAVVPGQATFNVGQTNNYNFAPLNVYTTPLDRWSLFGQARYEINPAVEAFTEGFFVRSRVTQQIAPSASFFNAFRLPLNNQFLTPQQSQQLCQAGVNLRTAADGPGAPIRPTAAQCEPLIAGGTEIDAIIARRFTEAGPRVTEFTSNVWQVVAGLRGPLTPSLGWELSTTYGEADRVNTGRGQGLFDRFQQSIRGCPAGSAGGCVPINIFGADGSIGPDVFRFLDVATNTFVRTDITTVQGVVQGDFGLASPFATTPLGFAVGGEYRRYRGAQRGDLPSSTPGAVLGAGGAFTTIEGSYDSKEGFIEAILPLVEDRPFFHNLTVEGGIRYADYSTTGGDITWKAGGSWSPIPDVKFRGIYTSAVRAPNLAELFSPVNTVLNNRAIDPCQGTVAQISARGPNFLALCTEQLNRVGAGGLLGTVPAPFAGQINVTTGGNINLDPERARTITAGAVLQPRFLENFAVTLDYFNIDLKDAITSPSQSDVIDGCFSQADPSFFFCQDIGRNPLTGGLSGDPSTTRGPLILLSNLGRIKTDGFDLGASWRRDFGLFGFGLAFNGTHTRSFTFQSIPTTFARQCAGFYSISCDPPQPRWVWNARATVTLAMTDISLRWRHLNHVKVEPRTTCVNFTAGEEGNCGPANILPAYTLINSSDYFDLSFQHRIGEQLSFTFIIENLLDRDAPDVGNTIGSTAFNSGNTYPSVYDPLGRKYRVGINFRF